MGNLIFVLVDGLNMSSAMHMSYLAACKEQGAIFGCVDCELPTLSRPIYSTLFTGEKPLKTGITTNNGGFLSAECFAQSFFSKLHQNGQTCAMAAYYWMREIYNGESYNIKEHRLTINANGPIKHGIFYNTDDYPDAYVFQDAEALRLHYEPEFLLVHTMGVDAAGHLHGANSAKYRLAVRVVDMLLAEYVQKWIADNATVIVTSDHGMHADGAHNDISDDVRKVPYWIIGTKNLDFWQVQSQVDWHKLLCQYFSILLP